jgi:nicotinate phosphoribosyltransferase
MNGLLTDLYQLTMAAGYVRAGKARERATFELYIRRLPRNRNYVIAAGLQQAVEYLLDIRFGEEEIGYLRGLAQFAGAAEEFFDALRRFRFSGDVYAVPEGTPVFAGEPILVVRAPLMEAQIPETYLLSMIGFQSLVATKAARAVETAAGRAVVEFGTRRAHSPEAGVLAARAAYIGGCAGTSNTLAGFRYGIPVFGTAAHSWVLSFPSEAEAFAQLQGLLGAATVYLVDTYDTVEGARVAARLGRPLWGVRLDSGNLVELSRAVRRVLDDAGLQDAKIMATGDLNEYKILELVAVQAPIDAFGVGTDLATSADAPSLGAVYKLVEVQADGIKRYTAKLSADKSTVPGAKQIFRYADHDEIACVWECPPYQDSKYPVALLRPVVAGGVPVEPLPDAHAARKHCAESLQELPRAVRTLFDAKQPYPVHYSAELRTLIRQARTAAGASTE